MSRSTYHYSNDVKHINPSGKFGFKFAKCFIGSVKNTDSESATTRWNDKVKKAKECGIVAMVIGASMAVVAAGLMAGFSALLIPTGVFMAFGVAAFLYGAVLTTIAINGVKSDMDSNASHQAELNQKDTSEQKKFIPKVNGELVVNENTCLNLYNYDLSELNVSELNYISKQMQYLHKKNANDNQHENVRSLLQKNTLYLLDAASKNKESNSLSMQPLYRKLIPYCTIPKHEQDISIVESEDPIEPVKAIVSKVSDLSATNGFEKIEGLNRIVYINKKRGYGIKLINPKTSLDSIDMNPDRDLRLNAIYKDERFYGGKYKEYAKLSVIQLKDKDGNIVNCIQFPLIKNSSYFEKNEKIPFEAIRNLEKIGYFPSDAKAENFVKVMNGDECHYIPIDAKFISKNKSNSIRTKDLRKYARYVEPHKIKWY